MTTSQRGLAIFDIDGTVSDCRHRVHYAKGPEPEWEKFFAASGEDAALTHGVGLAQRYAAAGTLAWLTGRPERFRPITTEWLSRHGLPSVPLYMRPNDDLTPAADFKSRQLAELAKLHEIALVVDDDEGVLAALADAGWPILRADWMSE